MSRWPALPEGRLRADLQPCEGGTLMALTREITTFGPPAAVMMPFVRMATGLGMPTMVQDLSLACADLVEEEP